MTASVNLNNSLNRTEETYKLELSFIELHFIMKAMSCYAHKHGYGNWDSNPTTPEHAAGAEKLHDELTELYSSSNY